MKIVPATPSDFEEALACLTAAFAADPITGFLLQQEPGYQKRLTQFFSLLMRARVALNMPVLVARGAPGIHGAAMGYTTEQRPWPNDVAEDWSRFEKSLPGLPDRMALYDEIAEKSKPATPHYYLGVIGVEPRSQGIGVGKQLLDSFCSVSATDQLSSGVYLETANPSNVRFYERAGFIETSRGRLGTKTLWCMFLPHAQRNDA